VYKHDKSPTFVTASQATWMKPGVVLQQLVGSEEVEVEPMSNYRCLLTTEETEDAEHQLTTVLRLLIAD